jgi:hypothetical protein
MNQADFDRKLRDYERACDNLPGGPGDDSDCKEDDTDHVSQSAFERKVEAADNRRREKQEDELIRSMDRSKLGVSRKNFDPRLDGPWNYEGHGGN